MSDEKMIGGRYVSELRALANKDIHHPLSAVVHMLLDECDETMRMSALISTFVVRMTLLSEMLAYAPNLEPEIARDALNTAGKVKDTFSAIWDHVLRTRPDLAAAAAGNEAMRRAREAGLL